MTSLQLAQASGVVTLYCGRTADSAERMSRRDLYWLKQATAWQATWQAGQVSFEERSSVASLDQDGIKATFSREWQMVLAPLAARALKNLSWKRTRVVNQRPRRAYRNFLLESSDPYDEWSA
ncbi:hypothetical protein ACFFTK_08940 [Pseudonocardia petroleophila]|uniref:Uncharacterized protein n=1 Tax=Pseudonocardia petroleophila TaxID=37331 RepID=A0A7G7MFV2_9PSEU|nr:hypothetical protein [Pseudonocardia petroleophila]QNG51663.1 hypothetical protein H6H00_26745 [Pseudonocardia petroleophila]